MGTARAVTITALGNVIAPVVGLVTAPILAVALGVTARGELAAATAPLLLASNAMTLGLPNALTFFTSRRAPREGRLIAFSLIALGLLGLLASLVIAVLSTLLSAGDAELAWLISLAGLCTSPALVLGGLRAVALGQQRWGLVTWEKVFSSAARLIAIAVVWVSGSLDLISATVIMSATTFAGVIVYVALAVRSPEDDRTAAEAASIREVLSYGLRVWMGSLTGILLIRIGQTLMVPLSGAFELGLFAVAVTISEAALVFNAAVSTVIFSQEARQADGTRLAEAARISTLVTWVTALGIGALSIWAVPFFFGEEFRATLPSLWILLLAVVLGNPGSVAGQGLNARQRPGLRSASLAIALVLNVVVMIALAPTLGAVGAAVAQLCANVAAGMLNLVWLKTKFGLPMHHFLAVRRSDVRRVVTLVRGRLGRK